MKIKIKPKEFSEILLRKDILLTQRQFAKKAGISEAQICRMKQDGKWGAITTAKKILDALPGVCFDDIFFVLN